MPGEAWAPGLTDVARHVPRRTRDTKTPGSDRLLMTFSSATTPSDANVQQMIDDTLSAIVAQLGELPAGAAESPEVSDLARQAVEWQVAADIEIAYPNRDQDVQTAAALTARARLAFTALVAAISAAQGSGYDAAIFPQWGFPTPPAYGDTSPGSGSEHLIINISPAQVPGN